MDAGMTERALAAMGDQDLDLVFLENVGNLICPAEFDTGSGRNIMILSIPEGDDKPLKYPLMFEKSDALLLTKTDTVEYFDFDFEACEKRVKALNPDIRIFPVSAKTGAGMDAFEDWLREEVKSWKK
jgi:hydrogenase nickel incorporation protein HypB